jgi:hypothetical protein
MADWFSRIFLVLLVAEMVGLAYLLVLGLWKEHPREEGRLFHPPVPVPDLTCPRSLGGEDPERVPYSE